jgi:hypothetical protein
MSRITDEAKKPTPPYRRLRVFAFDPLFSRQLDTSDINEVTLKLPWDEHLEIGPVDDYLEVVDYDPASQAFYEPVDLTDPKLIAQDGLPPSEGNPQFHQQMAYAVARTTIGHFERALGRRALWSKRLKKKDGGYEAEYFDRLRIYPHALRQANAFYSPAKKALLFGYFPASQVTPGMNMPGETVFACLSYDVIAHETTHALLDGLHSRFIEPSNIDALALHEAFADIVALFQHFTHPEVLKNQIAKTGGDIAKQNLLGQLAFQLGQATGSRGALRDAIGTAPNPRELLEATEPHARGAILVAAIFDAYLSIYKFRIRDLLRIASGGTGIPPEGEIPPDLVNRLAAEAAKTAEHILRICIRALDYCPAVDIDFGDYLRALITADQELVPDDPYHYRLAVIEAFRKRGIYPRSVRNLCVESLIWHEPDEREQEILKKVFSGPCKPKNLLPEWNRQSVPKKIIDQVADKSILLHRQFAKLSEEELHDALKITLKKGKDSLYRNDKGIPTLEIYAVRPAYRIGPDMQTVTELVVEMTQRRRGYLDTAVQKKVDNGEIDPPEPDFIFRGGCTLLIDPAEEKVKYCIYKDIMNDSRLNRMRNFILGSEAPPGSTSLTCNSYRDFYTHIIREDQGGWRLFEPFGLLHRNDMFGGDQRCP